MYQWNRDKRNSLRLLIDELYWSACERVTPTLRPPGPKAASKPSRQELLGIYFWRKVREERIWAKYMGEKGGWCSPTIPNALFGSPPLL
jgi:hypothetical protein